jgi:hypothetical protein
MIKQVSADPTLVLEIRVPSTGKDGRPSCATVEHERWRVVGNWTAEAVKLLSLSY